MRVLCLFKRRYMRKDLILDRYARLYELPRALARAGHDVRVLCLNYRGHGAPFEALDVDGDGRLRWAANDLGVLWPLGLWRHWQEANALIETWRPDVLLGGSDAVHVALTHALARRHGTPYAIDLYDNFASFGLTRLPGLAQRYHAALHAADGITCVSAPLVALVEADARPRGRVLVLESTIDGVRFVPGDRAAARDRLGLPRGGFLIGTAGALDASRGTGALCAAFTRLRAEGLDVGLVLAGSLRGAVPLPSGPDVHALGELPHAAVADVFTALDVAVVCMRDTAFGRYAFPQKLYEIIGCGTPLVAARVGAIAATLAPWPRLLFTPDDVDSLTDALRAQLTTPFAVPVTPPTWHEQGARLAALLGDVVGHDGRSA